MRLKVWSTGYNSEENVEKGQYVEEGGEAMINVLIEKENSAPNRVKCQKHTKIKDVTWWVLVGDSQNNLLAMKKVSVKRKVELKLQIDVPENLDRNQVRVYLVADSYLGLDQVETVKFKVK